MTRSRRGLVCLVFAFAAGCSSGKGAKPASAVLDAFPPAVLSSSGNVTTLVTMGSGAQAYMAGLMPYIVALTGGDPACPVVDVNGGTTTVTGGCTDKSGNSFAGTIIATTTTSGTTSSAKLRYEQFEISATTTCKAQPKTTSSRWNGTFEQNAATASPTVGYAIYDLDLRLDAVSFDPDTCADRSPVEAWRYHGTVTENTSVDAFDGSGRVGTSELGVASASTTGEILDTGACSSEAVSGSTTLEADGHTAVIVYDGATDCSPDSTVTWTYDGADRGTLTGIACEVAPSGGSAAALAWITALSASAIVLRRRVQR